MGMVALALAALALLGGRGRGARPPARRPAAPAAPTPALPAPAELTEAKRAALALAEFLRRNPRIDPSQGERARQAVSAMQTKMLVDPPSGRVGPITRNKARLLGVTLPATISPEVRT